MRDEPDSWGFDAPPRLGRVAAIRAELRAKGAGRFVDEREASGALDVIAESVLDAGAFRKTQCGNEE